MGFQKIESIVCFGEILWDMLPDGPKPGGAPMNVAIHLKRLGMDPLLVSRIGNDRPGDGLIRFLKESKLDIQYIQKDDILPTSRVLVSLDDKKNATYEICEPVAWDNILPVDEFMGLAGKTGLVVYGTLASRNSPTRNTLRKFFEQSHAIRLLDVNLRPPFDNHDVVEYMMRAADFIKLNDDELAKIAGWFGGKGDEFSRMEWMVKYFDCQAVCLTRGANGAVLWMNNEFYEHPGFLVKPVDTVGSGDSFLSGLIVRLIHGDKPQKALEFACATGAYVATQKGAVPEYSLQDIFSLME